MNRLIDVLRERGRQLAPLAVVAVTAGMTAIPLMIEPRYYFLDDSQAYYFGIWDNVGERVSSGDWSFIDPSAWMSGNAAVDTQYGLWSPVLLLISLLARTAEEVMLFNTLLKFVLLAAGAIGVYLLSRSFRVGPWWAALAAISAPLNGTTFYVDAPSWNILLLIWAIFPFLWWGLRIADRRGPLPAMIGGVLLVTLGFVQGVLVAAVVFIAVLLETVIRRSWVSLRWTLVSGLVTGAATLAIFVPSLLSASVTWRGATGIENNGMLVGSLDALLSGPVIAATPPVSSFWGDYAPFPILYLGWFLPLLALVEWKVAWARLRAEIGLLAFAAVSLLIMLGPSNVGPVRVPVRIFAEFATIAIVLAAVAVSVSALRVSTTRVVTALVLVAVTTFAAWSDAPQNWRPLGVGAALTVLGVLGAIVLLRNAGPRAAAGAWVGFVLVSAAAIGVQHVAAPVPAMEDFQLPEQRADYEVAAGDAVGDTIVVGAPRYEQARPDIWDEVLIGNSWYLSTAEVQNLYTPIGHAEYGRATCMEYIGQTCGELLDRLFEPVDGTDTLLVDALAVSSVIIVNSSQDDPSTVTATPAGWSVAGRGEYTTTWTRDVQVEPAGGIVPQDGITQLSSDSSSVTFRIDAETEAPVLVSRLAWPGYSASAGVLETVDGWLVAVDVDGLAAGEVVTVQYTPPGSTIVVAALGLGGVGVLGGVLWWLLERRRRSELATS